MGFLGALDDCIPIELLLLLAHEVLLVGLPALSLHPQLLLSLIFIVSSFTNKLSLGEVSELLGVLLSLLCVLDVSDHLEEGHPRLEVHFVVLVVNKLDKFLQVLLVIHQLQLPEDESS